MDLLADFLHFGTSVFLLHVGLEQREVWGVKSAVWSVKCAGSSGKWEVRSVECEVWSLSLECEERSVKCEVWGLECEGSSEKWEVWSVDCEVWSVECEECMCAVWGVECRGKDTVGTGCLWTIGHLCLGNFRRRLARVYVIWWKSIIYIYIWLKSIISIIYDYNPFYMIKIHDIVSQNRRNPGQLWDKPVLSPAALCRKVLRSSTIPRRNGWLSG